MNAIEQISNAACSIGYRQEALVSDYAFADVLSQDNPTRRVSLVAFSRTPPSYRSAAIAVTYGEGRNPIDVVREHRALGAPLLFVIENDDVTVWQVRSNSPPRAIEQKIKLNDVAALFEGNKHNWHPDAIYRAKAIGAASIDYQLDFVDLGLLPAIEGEIHVKLDRLLVETLDLAKKAVGGDTLDPRTLFRVAFRLIAAKVLQDRGHDDAEGWDQNNLASVLTGIEKYYSLGAINGHAERPLSEIFEAAWQHLLSGISFSNISSDDLAFVYENTLVTPETRKIFGTHSTPRQLAEYVVQRLELHKHDPADLQIYEPFAGAGIFLVSALRHLRDLLPADWSDEKRHQFLIEHISGDEYDTFACEVARLSLILADYPNHNDWQIKETDLFLNGNLAERMVGKNVILCNPPFEAFKADEKSQYPISGKFYSKAVATLSAAIDVKPLALGFVLPQSFILEKQFAELRKRIEAVYSSVEIVSIADRIFGASSIESAAVIAHSPRLKNEDNISLVSTEIADRDRVAFLKSGTVTFKRTQIRKINHDGSGHLWIPPLDDIWTYLSLNPQLSTVLRPRWGMRWNYPQNQAVSDVSLPGYERGYFTSHHFKQFVGHKAEYLDCRQESLSAGFDHDWLKPKLIMNAARLSRGAWRIGALVDEEGLRYSQQFFGLWPKQSFSREDLFALAGVLNGPVANAFLTINSPRDRFRSNIVGEIPIPNTIPAKLGELVLEYVLSIRQNDILDMTKSKHQGLLNEIDALTIAAYDLPPKLERQLLGFFADSKRPSIYDWTHWDEAYPISGLTFNERLSGRFKANGGWTTEVFKPLPKHEVELFREYAE